MCLLINHVSCRIFRQNIKSPRFAPVQPRFVTLLLLAFPKTKITFEIEEISDRWWDSGKYKGAADGNENCVRSQDAYFKENWGVIVLCTMCLVSCIFFNKYLFFIVHGWILSGQTSGINKIHRQQYNDRGKGVEDSGRRQREYKWGQKESLLRQWVHDAGCRWCFVDLYS